MVASVPGECLRCRGTADNINHFESIRHEGPRADDLAVPCRQLHLWALRLGSPGRFSQLSAFRGIILRAGLTPCLIASGRLLFSQSLSHPPRLPLAIFSFSPVLIIPDEGITQPTIKCNRGGLFHFLNPENTFPQVFMTFLSRTVVFNLLVPS